MKAILWKSYGPPEQLGTGELDNPTPKADEVLVKIQCATVTAGDCEMRRFDIHPLFWFPLRLLIGTVKPRRPLLGQEFSGTIEAVGPNVTTYKVGDRVFASTGIQFGTYCEYRIQKASSPMAEIPEQVSFEQAATIPTGGINGLHFLKNGRVTEKQHLLINGAGGSIGTYALQIAKHWGATVSCVDHSSKLNMLQLNGADTVIDYEIEDFHEHATLYDCIIDISGHINYRKALKCLKPTGILVLGNPATWHMFRSIWTNLTNTRKVKWSFAGESKENLQYLANLIDKGHINPVIDQRYPLEETIVAHKYVESGLKKGNVIIEI